MSSGPPVKLDPFKPAAPVIPGVPQRAPEEKKPEEAKAEAPKPSSGLQKQLQDPKMMAGAGASAVVLIGLIALGWWAFKPAPPPAPVVIEQPASTLNAPATATSAAATPQLPDAPGPVATVEEMSKPWSVAKFQFHRTTGETLTGMVVRLPAAPGYWGLLSVAPYGRCEMQLNTDLKDLRQTYGYAASHPMMVDPCTQVVYDPLALGNASGAWVRGKIAAGPGIRPPLEVEIKIEQGMVVADRSE